MNGGELNPLLRGQTDIPRYRDALELCINAQPLVTGGATRRPGTRFIDDEGIDTEVRAVPFVIFRSDLGVEQGYIVEFKDDFTIDFYTNEAKIAFSIASPFTNNVERIRYEQFDNVLYLVHPDFPPQELKRVTDTNWTISEFVVTLPPPIGAPIKTVSNLTRSGGTATATVTSHGYGTGDEIDIQGADQPEYNGAQSITVAGVNSFTYPVSGAPSSPATGSITAQRLIEITRVGSVATVVVGADVIGSHGFRVGEPIRVAGADQPEYNGDFVIDTINGVGFTYTVSGAPATPSTGTIVLTHIHWGTDPVGYPAAITFFEQRMVIGGTKAEPTVVNGSVSGDITNHIVGVGDSDGFEFVLAAATSRILHLAADRLIHVGTADKELNIEGGVEKPLTPTNVRIRSDSRAGTVETARPLILDDELLFITRHSKKLRGLTEKPGSESKQTAPDLSLVSEHLAALGMVTMAYQAEPRSTIWIVTSDGKLLSITFDKPHQVIAWAQHTTDGLFKDVAVIPHNDTDQVWVAVSRTIDGANRTYLEILDIGLNTDSSVVDTDVTGKTVWTGLSHLEGETVDVVGDGVVMPQQVVESGQITTPDPVKSIEIGLHYKTTIKDLPPEAPTNIGTSQGQSITTHSAIVRLHESIGCEINGEVIPFRSYGADNYDEAVQPFTGDKEASLLDDDDNGVITIVQDQPLPLTVLAIIKEISVNG